jgi:hypothetical protein
MSPESKPTPRVCSITDALSIVGDRYALLVAREIRYGHTRFHPILLALKEWGDRHCNPGAEPVLFEHSCGAEFHALTVCAACGEPIGVGDLKVVGGTHPVEATL